LVLLDNNEYRLYEVNRPLQSIAAQVVPVLLDYGSPNVFRLLQTLGVVKVFHVAGTSTSRW
jgi:FlaA1/EpsC-like NDP-sugar epimerase